MIDRWYHRLQPGNGLKKKAAIECRWSLLLALVVALATVLIPFLFWQSHKSIDVAFISE